MPDTILIVDDEAKIAELLRIVLEREGFDRVLSASNVAEALELAERERPSVFVLDVGLPDGTGFDIAMRVRETSDAPIIFLTARADDVDKLTGFGVGGDDYVTKPFNPLEVAARIKAQLRRSKGGNGAAPASIQLGRVCIEVEAARVLVDDIEIQMPALEFKILAFLAGNPDRVFTAGQIYRQVWGEEPMGGEDNTVSVHVRRLREKIEVDPSAPELLLTVRGLGYKLVPPVVSVEATSPEPPRSTPAEGDGS